MTADKKGDNQLVIGEHAIVQILKHRFGDLIELYYTEKAKKNLNGVGASLRDPRLKCLKEGEFRLLCTKLFQDFSLDPVRVPGSMIGVFKALSGHDLGMIWHLLEQKKNVKVLALDQVTDLGNSAAILRICAFYAIDALVLPQKNSSALSPQFFRIASGATEWVPIVRVSSLPSALKKMKQKGLFCFGLSEESNENLSDMEYPTKGWCAVLGSEQLGLSHATRYALDKEFALDGPSEFTTFNVSVAAAVTLERLYRLSL